MLGIIVKILIFLFGMGVSVQVVGALYSVLDLSYTMDTAYPIMLRKMLTWLGISLIIVWLLGNHWRGAFVWGMIMYVPFYIINSLVINMLAKSQYRLKKN